MVGTFSTQMQESDLLQSQNHLFDTLSIMQHHDAITGTHNLKVGEDYSAMMNQSVVNALSKWLAPYGVISS